MQKEKKDEEEEEDAAEDCDESQCAIMGLCFLYFYFFVFFGVAFGLFKPFIVSSFLLAFRWGLGLFVGWCLTYNKPIVHKLIKTL